MTEQTEEPQANTKLYIFSKKRAIQILAGLTVGWLVTAGLFYYIGSQSKNGQITACQETLENVSDMLNEYDLDDSYEDDLEKCDPSYK